MQDEVSLENASVPVCGKVSTNSGLLLSKELWPQRDFSRRVWPDPRVGFQLAVSLEKGPLASAIPDSQAHEAVACLQGKWNLCNFLLGHYLPLHFQGNPELLLSAKLPLSSPAKGRTLGTNEVGLC